MQRFKNKIVVITGAGSGIGRSTSLRLDSEGADLVMIDKNQKDLAATKKMLKNKNSSTHVMDISSINSTKNFLMTLKKNIKGSMRSLILQAFFALTIPMKLN
jgi:NADP-dependent 3-hydroxy acid dehydrogenase YdfG